MTPMPLLRDNALFVGDQGVRRFSRQSHQFSVVERFHTAHWAQSIPSPFTTCPSRQSSTLRDLNDSIEGQLISFHGDGRGGI